MFSSISSFFGRGSQPAAAQQDDPVQLKVSRIITYPIKSCAGIELQQSQYSIEGLTYDRKWMVIDAHTKRFITARTHPKLFLVKPAIDLEKQCLHVTVPSHGTYSVPLEPPKDDEDLTDLQVWSSQCCGKIVAPAGSELAAALSELIGTECLLVHASPTQPRLIGGQQYINDLFGNEDDILDYPLEDITTLFADGYPFLVVTESTFHDVAKWLEQGTKDVRMDMDELVARYRPNIVIAGATEGFIEEAWEAIRIGDDVIYPISRCPRCPMPDASPKDGTMSARRLPGKIVEAHRSRVDRIHKGPCLGMNAISKARSGTLQVGSTVKVLRTAARTEGFAEGRFTRAEDTWS